MLARRTPSSGRSHGGVPRAHAGQRARAGAAAEPEQHGLGLVVEGVPEQHRRVRVRAGGLAARRSGRRRAAASVPPGPATSHRGAPPPSTPERRAAARRWRPARSADPSCSPWSTTAACTRPGAQRAGGGEQRAGVGAAGAGDQQRRRRVRLGQPVERGPHGRAHPPLTAGARWSRTLASGDPRSQSPGSASSARVGSVSGRLPHPVEPVHPDLGTDVLGERRADRVLPHLRLDAEQRPQQPVDPAAAAAARGEPLADRRDARDDRRARPRP